MNTINKIEDKYLVTWPWRQTPPKLPSNFSLAKGVLASLYKRYESKPEYIDAIERILKQQIESGIIEKVPNATPGPGTHYLPFHLIIDDKKSTPIRIVYNGSARTKKGNNSINDCLLKGVNLLSKMFPILLRARLQAILVLADIEKAFHQINLQESERDYLRFLWYNMILRKQGIIVIETYQFC